MKFTKNMSSADRIIRLALAALVVVLYLTDVISGTWAIILGVLAVIFLVTSLVAFCPMYGILGMSTRKNE